MSIKNDKEREISIESEFNKLNISDLVITNHESCRPWCKECVPPC